LGADPLLPLGIQRLDELNDDLLGATEFSALLRAVCDLRRYERLVLMFDELDHYAESEDSTSLAREFFNRMENWCRALKPGVTVLAAGGIGVLGLSSRFGSQFTADASWHELAPFDEQEVSDLVAPFADDGRPLDQATREALRIFSGHHPELFVYGLEHLWALAHPTAADVDPIYARFIERSNFVEQYWRSVTSPRVSQAGLDLLEAIKRGKGEVAVAKAQAAVSPSSGAADLTLRDVLRLLRAAILVRVEGPLQEDPLRITLIPSVLQPAAGVTTRCETLREQLLADLLPTLTWLYDQAPDFFDGGTTQDSLVPEATFSSVIAYGLRRIGWSVTREPQGGAGYADIRASHPNHAGAVVVEVKTWGEKNDYEQVHNQILGYWISDVVAGAVVMLRATEPRSDWADEYVVRCLQTKALATRLQDRPPLSAHFEARSDVVGGRSATVDHLLLRLPRPSNRVKKPTTKAGTGGT
jgi:hypothetical protein